MAHPHLLGRDESPVTSHLSIGEHGAVVAVYAVLHHGLAHQREQGLLGHVLPNDMVECELCRLRLCEAPERARPRLLDTAFLTPLALLALVDRAQADNDLDKDPKLPYINVFQDVKVQGLHFWTPLALLTSIDWTQQTIT
jgi:hypothetical protein